VGSTHFPVGNMRLKAKFWQDNLRANQAANVPFHSLRFKPRNTDDAGAVSLLQFALIRIEAASPRLAPKDLPTNPPFKGGPWGRFFLDNTDEFAVGTYDIKTEDAVRRFQDEAGLEVDGLAGMNTLQRLDKVLLAIEKLPNIGPPSPF
jgi:peptidoglycan hydrolase-like protein with peptidoglycan-binding domain